MPSKSNIDTYYSRIATNKIGLENISFQIWLHIGYSSPFQGVFNVELGDIDGCPEFQMTQSSSFSTPHPSTNQFVAV